MDNGICTEKGVVAAMKFNTDEMGIKEIQNLAKELRIPPSYKEGGVRFRKNKAQLIRDIKRAIRKQGELVQ